MAALDDDFQRLMADVRAGSDQAVQQLADRFGPLVLRVVRRRLASRLRSRVDSVDCQQEVWASFFRSRGRLSEFEDPRSLVRYLARMAKAKVVDLSRRMGAARRGGVEAPEPLTPDVLEEAFAHDPTPSQTAISRERLEEIVKGLDDRARQIVLLRSQGASFEDIGRELEVHPRTVRRTLLEISRQDFFG